MIKINDILQKHDEWDLYNSFFMMNDIDRLRKFLVRQKLFEYTVDIPGDIVELGVMKGIGGAQLLKIRNIYTPASNKKVIGFDFFDTYNSNDESLNEYYNTCNVNVNKGIDNKDIEKLLDEIDKNNHSYQLIKGNVLETIPKYLQENL